jgi:riboflavin synthase
VFTGIVHGIAQVLAVEPVAGVVALRIVLPASARDGLQIGASVSIDGVCLTVAELNPDSIRFDVVKESLSRSTIGQLKSGDDVHFERSLRIGDEIGGHFLSGHVDCVAELQERSDDGGDVRMRFSIPSNYVKYVFEKGYIAIQGVSLTVASVDRRKSMFSVALVPETLRATSLGRYTVNQAANIEIDRMTQAVVETVERMGLEAQSAPAEGSYCER